METEQGSEFTPDMDQTKEQFGRNESPEKEQGETQELKQKVESLEKAVGILLEINRELVEKLKLNSLISIDSLKYDEKLKTAQKDLGFLKEEGSMIHLEDPR